MVSAIIGVVETRATIEVLGYTFLWLFCVLHDGELAS